MPLNIDLQNKKAPTNRLEDYGLLASALLLSAGVSNASIVYTDLSPDVLVVNDTIGIDFDGDGNDDFRFGHFGFDYATNFQVAKASWTGLQKGAVFTTGTTAYGATYRRAAALSAGAPIDVTRFFNASIYTTTGALLAAYFLSPYVSNIYGFFLGATDKYLGLQFPIGGNIHYGWVRLTLPTDGSSITIKDFAYEDSPGVGIAAGAGSVTSVCSTADAPDNLTASIAGGAATFSWDAIPLSIGCQISAGTVGSGFPLVRNISGVGVSSIGPIPLGAVPPGNYEARVRCVCSISPLDATPFSDTVLFVVPSPRVAEASNFGISPNPTADVLSLEYSGDTGGEVNLRVFSITGQEMYARKTDLGVGSYRLLLDVSDFRSGAYFFQIEMEGRILVEPFEVIR